MKTTNNLTEINITIKENPAVILYFYSDKCAPCISLRPKVQELIENEYPEIEFVLIDSENNPEIAAGYNVFSNPVIIIYFDGKEYRRESKYISITQLSEIISRPYGMIFEN